VACCPFSAAFTGQDAGSGCGPAQTTCN
jgi:hypothetical protein